MIDRSDDFDDDYGNVCSPYSYLVLADAVRESRYVCTNSVSRGDRMPPWTALELVLPGDLLPAHPSGAFLLGRSPTLLWNVLPTFRTRPITRRLRRWAQDSGWGLVYGEDLDPRGSVSFFGSCPFREAAHTVRNC